MGIKSIVKEVKEEIEKDLKMFEKLKDSPKKPSEILVRKKCPETDSDLNDDMEGTSS